jgi:ATP-dependent RNA helicase DDX46/PRP5
VKETFVKEVKEVIEIKDEPSFDPAKFDKEEEQRRLELEMIKRKERIERWRAERKKKEIEIHKKPSVVATPSAKKWSLEDDEEDDVEPVTDPKIIEIEDSPTRVKDESNDEPVKKEKEEDIMEVESIPPPPKLEAKESSPEPEVEKPVEEPEDDDVDPLDAFMKGIDNEVRKINKMSKPITSSKSSGVVIVTGNVKSKPQTETKKGELIEQNQDGLEYSSEEEQEDIKDTAANLANKQKKELAKVDHSTVDYNTFKKNFYVEVPEISRLTNEEVDVYKSELEGIQVKGKGCPRPIKTWAQCGVSKKEMDSLKKLSFEKPTPIQCQAIPAIMSGRDLIGIAKTGNSKEK